MKHLLDRLKITPAKIEGMIRSIEKVIALPDPTNQIISTYKHPNGLLMSNKTVPFGKIFIIYESRLDVTFEAAIIALKDGFIEKALKNELKHTKFQLTLPIT